MKLNLIAKIVFALLIGIAITLFVFQDQEKFKLIVKEQISQLAQSQLDCEIDCNIKNLNLIFPAGELCDVFVYQKGNPQWFWKCKKIKIKCSWLDYFFTKKFKADLQLYDLDIYTECSTDGKVAILPHLHKLLLAQNSNLPLTITILKLNKAEIELENKEMQIKSKFNFNSESRFTKSLKTFCYLTDGNIFNKDIQVLKNVSGNLQIFVPNFKTDQTELEVNCICDLPILNEHGSTTSTHAQHSFRIDSSTTEGEVPLGPNDVEDSPRTHENNQCFVVGKWQNNKGNFKINTLNGKLNLDEINITKNGNKIDGDVNLNSKLSYIQKLTNIFPEYICEGNLTAKLNFNKDNNNQNISCDCIIKDITSNLFNYKIDELKFNLRKENDRVTGNATLKKDEIFEIASEFNWNEKQKIATLKFENISDIFLDQDKKWCIKAKNLSNVFKITPDFNIQGDYSLCVSNSNLQKELNNVGKINFSKNNLKIEGNLAIHPAFAPSIFYKTSKDRQSEVYPESIEGADLPVCSEGNVSDTISTATYLIDLLVNPKITLKTFRFLDSENKSCINANTNNENIEILIDYKNLRKILPENLVPPFAGEGLAKLTGKISKKSFTGKINPSVHPECNRGINPLPESFTGKINLINGNITLPKTYNLIKNIEGDIEINFFSKRIILKNLVVTLFKGSLECRQAVLTFNNELSSLQFMHFPVVLKDFFLNWKKDIFSTLSGFLLFQKNNNENSIKGNLIIDRGLLKNNILSDEFRKEILGDQYQNLFSENKTQLDISLTTRKPVRIKTAFFETQARADLKITKTVSNPEIVGTIYLTGGNINFPYKCLNIINGSIYFLHNQPYDPIINLMVRNKIKQYAITMHLTGSAKNSHITFESSPPLSEEQIGTLLLVGSEKATLNAIMPALIAQNLKNIILGSAQAHTNMQKYFDAFLKPFKYVRFVPSFTDETGRAGFKGAVEIDVNDKLRGSIEKNFSQKEDYKVEIDYDLTDDVSFKAIKDERGDLGAELEMKWKW